MDSQPVTRAELLEALAALKQEILGVIRGGFAEQSERTQEVVRDAQTEILKAFLPFQESSNIRFRKVPTRMHL